MRLLSITVRNFRGFGPAVEAIDLDGDLVLLFGPNGHGKTSLSEAIEWLFYGTTKRRERGEGYSKAEYAGSFANAHGGAPTEVTLNVRFNGRDVSLTRRLGDKESSSTFVDDAPADFSSVGLHPLEAYYPVVAQHGLQTFVHAKPKDRRDAICAALGLDELTSLKSALESARGSFQRTPPKDVTEARKKLSILAAPLSQFSASAHLAKRWASNPPAVDAEEDERSLLAAASELTSQTLPDVSIALAALRSERAKAGRAVFDLSLVAPSEDHSRRREDAKDRLSELVQDARTVDDCVASLAGVTAARYSAALLGFWQQGLSLAPVGTDCPMCEASTLTDEHRSILKSRLDSDKSTVAAISALDDVIEKWSASVQVAINAITSLGIKGLDDAGKNSLSSIIGEHTELSEYMERHDAWLAARRRLGEALRTARDVGSSTKIRAAQAGQLPDLIQERQSARDGLAKAADEFYNVLASYETAWANIADALGAKIAANERVAMIDGLGRSLQALTEVKILARYAAILEETQLLIRSVESATQRKQQDLLKSRGQEVKDLYALLNPGVMVGFDEMEPANDAMKLHATSFGVRMSAAANLSECQLNCLGLAMWLMRATTPSSPFGFVLLDDPVQAMDDDHAEAFISNVVPHLLDKNGKQVVVLSHVKNVVEKLRSLSLHRNVRHYHYENFELGGPVIVRQLRLQQALAEIKGAAGGNEANREYAVDRLRVLVESFVRELYLKQTGSAAPSSYDTANSGQLADLFRTIPGTDPSEHAGMKDTIRFCDPAHHTQTGYSVPLKSNIQPHIDRVSGLMKKYGLIT